MGFRQRSQELSDPGIDLPGFRRTVEECAHGAQKDFQDLFLFFNVPGRTLKNGLGFPNESFLRCAAGQIQEHVDPVVQIIAPLRELAGGKQALLKKGVRSQVLMRLPRPSVGGDTVGRALEIWPNEQPVHKRLADYILDSILEGKDIPSSWEGNGRLPTGEDGLIQTRIVCAIEESARTRREVAIPAG